MLTGNPLVANVSIVTPYSQPCNRQQKMDNFD